MKNRIVPFSQIPIGGKFKTSSNIVYRKLSTKKASPILNAQGNRPQKKSETTAFYSSNIQVTLL
jgi:hypothetical protein